jgi:hypothetical protein
MAAFVVSPSQLHRVLLLSWLLFAAGVLCFLPRHVAAARVGAGSYVTVSAASLAASGTTCDDPAPGSDRLAFLCPLVLTTELAS